MMRKSVKKAQKTPKKTCKEKTVAPVINTIAVIKEGFPIPLSIVTSQLLLKTLLGKYGPGKIIWPFIMAGEALGNAPGGLLQAGKGVKEISNCCRKPSRRNNSSSIVIETESDDISISINAKQDENTPLISKGKGQENSSCLGGSLKVISGLLKIAAALCAILAATTEETNNWGNEDGFKSAPWLFLLCFTLNAIANFIDMLNVCGEIKCGESNVKGALGVVSSALLGVGVSGLTNVWPKGVAEYVVPLLPTGALVGLGTNGIFAVKRMTCNTDFDKNVSGDDEFDDTIPKSNLI